MKHLSRQSALILSILMIVASLFLSVPALSFADPHPAFREKLKDHWSEKLLRSQIPELYFSDYAENNFQKFNPSELISQSAVCYALNRLYLWHNLPVLGAGYHIGGANNKTSEQKHGMDELKDNMDKTLKRKDILPLLEPFALKFGKESNTGDSFCRL